MEALVIMAVCGLCEANGDVDNAALHYNYFSFPT